MTYVDSLEQINIIIYILKLFCISLGTYYAVIKNTNKNNHKLKNIIGILITSIICEYIRNISNTMNSVICLILMLSIIFADFKKDNIGYYIIITTICLSINYALYIFSATISYFPNRILNIQSNIIEFAGIIIIYFIIVYLFSKIKRFKKGFSFLRENLINDYFDVLILNISIMILFLIIIIARNYKAKITGDFGIGLIITIIVMFITIQKSIQLYYKQKLLIKDLNETKEELEAKKAEVEKLEQENLNFSKISHSIAHKQRTLEYKLNKLMLNNETGEEIDLKDRIESITKDLKQPTTIELDKTNIPEIDDELSYMQSECNKNKIDFQLQINGNIHHMTNNYIDKEKLEILLADLIKNAIIAINHTETSNKSILVRLGIIDGTYSLYVYDTGIEFKQETLQNLGKKPSTTHKEEGGTGMGMMNTFDTLKQYNASMIIKEIGKPCNDNFTKVIQIKFDKKNEFKVESYRKV